MSTTEQLLDEAESALALVNDLALSPLSVRKFYHMEMCSRLAQLQRLIDVNAELEKYRATIASFQQRMKALSGL